MVVTIVAVLGISVGMYRLHSKSTGNAMAAFDAAMHGVAGRLGIRYRAPGEPNDWPGATGRYRERTVAVFVVSETERPMMTGIMVRYSRVIPDRALDALRAVRRTFSGGKLHIHGRPAAGATVPPSNAVQQPLQQLVSIAFEVEVQPDRVLITLQRKGYSFMEYSMQTNVDELCQTIEHALNLTLALEQL